MKPRQSFYDTKKYSPIQKSASTVGSYLKNVGKEVKDFGRVYKAAQEMSNRVGPGTDTEANRLRNQQDKEMGQVFGAILQGRRYNSKGKQIK